MSGQTEEAADAIINQCTPALDNAVAIGKKLDAVTDKASHQAVIFTGCMTVAGILVIILSVIFAILFVKKISNVVIRFSNHCMRSRMLQRNSQRVICTVH